MRRAILTLAMLSLTLPAVAEAKKKARKQAEPTPIVADWKQTVTGSDMDRLRDWRTAFIKSVNKARLNGNSESIEREGTLLSPDAALDNATPPAGQYQCRVIKLGAKAQRMPDYVVYPPYDCAITGQGELLGFAKSQGMQRPIGLFFPADERRMIFLGTMMLGDETRAMEYGRDSSRDMAGALERVGEKRWRLILPWPHFESMMDVIEITPAREGRAAVGSMASVR